MAQAPRPSLRDQLAYAPAGAEATVMRIVDAQIHTWGIWLPSNLLHWQTTSFMAAEAMAGAEAVPWPDGVSR
jgi:hypothetical protein